MTHDILFGVPCVGVLPMGLGASSEGSAAAARRRLFGVCWEAGSSNVLLGEWGTVFADVNILFRASLAYLCGKCGHFCVFVCPSGVQ